MADIQDNPNQTINEAENASKTAVSRDLDFRVGDKIVVNYKIVEGEKSRIQPYEGLVIGIKGTDVSKTFTVRRIGAGSVGVERIFPLNSPNIDSIKVLTEGNVRRSKLYYLRGRIGKAATKVRVQGR